MWLSLCNHASLELFIIRTTCSMNPACSWPTVLRACHRGVQKGLSRMKSPPRQRCFPHPTCTVRAENAELPLWLHVPIPQYYTPCTLATCFFVQRACVYTSFNQLFQDRCASLASEQCNYFPCSPLSKSRGFIGLLMVWFVVGRNKKDSNSLIILSYRYPAE